MANFLSKVADVASGALSGFAGIPDERRIGKQRAVSSARQYELANAQNSLGHLDWLIANRKWIDEKGNVVDVTPENMAVMQKGREQLNSYVRDLMNPSYNPMSGKAGASLSAEFGVQKPEGALRRAGEALHLVRKQSIQNGQPTSQSAMRVVRGTEEQFGMLPEGAESSVKMRAAEAQIDASGMSPEQKEEAKAKLHGVTSARESHEYVPETVMVDGKPTAAIFDKKTGHYFNPDMTPMSERNLQSSTFQSRTPTAQKNIKGAMVKSKQSPTGFAIPFYDPQTYQPVGWMPVTPSRYYQGTETSSSTYDPSTGLTTTREGTTRPLPTQEVDLSNVKQVGEGGMGEESAPEEIPQTEPSRYSTERAEESRQAKKNQRKNPRKAPPVPRRAKATSVNPSGLDQSGHIPQGSGPSPQVEAAANQLIDGMDINKIETKLRGPARALAEKYGWNQGVMTPKENMLINESETFLREAENSPALKVLDNARSRMKLSLVLRPGNHGAIGTAMISSIPMNDQEREFVRLYNQLVGTISGLSQLTRGGRVTEAQVNRLMMELPNPEQTRSSSDAKARIQRLLKEIDVARSQGGSSSSTPGHRFNWNSLPEAK